VCQVASAFQHLDPEIAERQLDLVRTALSAHAGARPLRGRSPTLSDMELALGPAAEVAQTADVAEQAKRAT
jgi:hypothetical protein